MSSQQAPVTDGRSWAPGNAAQRATQAGDVRWVQESSSHLLPSLQDIMCTRVVLTGRFQTLPLTLRGFGLDQAAPQHCPASAQILSLKEALQRRLDPVLPPPAAVALETACKLQSQAVALLPRLEALSVRSGGVAHEPAEDPVVESGCLAAALALADDVAAALADPEHGQSVREVLARSAPGFHDQRSLDRVLGLALRWCRLLPGETAGAHPATLEQAAGGLAVLCALSCLAGDAASGMLRRPAVSLVLCEVLGARTGTWPRRHIVHALTTALALMEGGGVLGCEALLGRWECPVPAETEAGGIWPPRAETDAVGAGEVGGVDVGEVDGRDEGQAGGAAEAPAGEASPPDHQTPKEATPNEQTIEGHKADDSVEAGTTLSSPARLALVTIPQVDGASGYASPSKRKHGPGRLPPGRVVS